MATKTHSFISDQFSTTQMMPQTKPIKTGIDSHESRNHLRHLEGVSEQSVDAMAKERGRLQPIAMVKTGQSPSRTLTGYIRMTSIKIQDGNDKVKAVSWARLGRMLSKLELGGPPPGSNNRCLMLLFDNRRN